MEIFLLGVDDLKNGHPTKWVYSESDKSLDGSTISHIVGREDDFIIFFCEDGALSWEHREIPEWAYAGIEQFEKLNCKIPTYLGQIHKKDIKAWMATCLLSVFRSRCHDNQTILACFDDAWDYVNEYEGRDILFAGEGFYLFQKEGLLLLQSSKLESEIGKAFTEASYLSQKAKHSLSGESLSQANRLIASAFSDYEQFDSEDIFSEAKSYIETQVREAAKISYLTVSSIVALVACIVMLVVYYQVDSLSANLRSIVLCGFAGVVGALVSVLQRSSTIQPEPFSSTLLITFQGVIRVFLGIVFGALVPICASAEIALGLAQDNVQALFIVSFFSGVNERFIPDLIEKNVGKSGL